ncbi:protein-tyrosine-phosphatase MKP1-like, partial [Trifolium medium]|nr:protein-tyrosine-phosphatase MKP1-like [Trifolium medium]
SDSIDYLFDSTNHVKGGGTNCELASRPGIVDSAGCQESSLLRNCVEPLGDSLSREDLNSTSLKAQLDSDRQSDFLGAVDWNRIGCDLLAQFDLPKNTVTK